MLYTYHHEIGLETQVPLIVKPKPLLTKRETEILKLIAEEYSSLEIADSLSISIKTVDTHRKSLIKKIGARNVVGLVKYALQLQIATL
ncbi:hypothetical protein GCM10023188_36180 [Pontibacter saemangeumensis]|uniref:HTH luxR-type domain-containing protein n=2 Tax=Pontibacter saemangeumensis TaxID=1084525 RepID=A0ABP8LXK5_9BACT